MQNYEYSELDMLWMFEIEQRRSEDQLPEFKSELESLAVKIGKSNFD